PANGYLFRPGWLKIDCPIPDEAPMQLLVVLSCEGSRRENNDRQHRSGSDPGPLHGRPIPRTLATRRKSSTLIITTSAGDTCASRKYTSVSSHDPVKYAIDDPRATPKIPKPGSKA